MMVFSKELGTTSMAAMCTLWNSILTVQSDMSSACAVPVCRLAVYLIAYVVYVHMHTSLISRSTVKVLIACLNYSHQA